jgi:hypothetical protein
MKEVTHMLIDLFQQFLNAIFNLIGSGFGAG